MQGATRIIGVDINDTKREKGMAFGMTDFINPRDSDKSISELVMEVTGGLGVDYSFECTGVAALVNQSIESTKIVRIHTFLNSCLNTTNTTTPALLHPIQLHTTTIAATYLLMI